MTEGTKECSGGREVVGADVKGALMDLVMLALEVDRTLLVVFPYIVSS